MGRIKSVERALEVLEILTNNPHGLGVTELSLKLDIAKSTSHRLLNTLSAYNYVSKDEQTDNYFIGTRVLYIANELLENLNLVNLAKDKINQLSETSNETVHLCLFDSDEVVYIDKVDSNKSIRMHSKIGKRSPMHSTGVGKAILAFLPNEEPKKILQTKNMNKFTENTITSISQMMIELEDINKKGYAIDDIENEEGVRCVAAPIFNHINKPVAAISISGPSNRITLERIQSNLGKDIIDTANFISKKLGNNNV